MNGYLHAFATLLSEPRAYLDDLKKTQITNSCHSKTLDHPVCSLATIPTMQLMVKLVLNEKNLNISNVTDSMEHSAIWEVNTPPLVKELVYGNLSYITVFTTHQWIVSYVRKIQTTFFHPISFRFSSILSHLCLTIQNDLFPAGFFAKTFTHSLSLLYNNILHPSYLPSFEYRNTT